MEKTDGEWEEEIIDGKLTPFTAPTKLNSYYLPWIMNKIFTDVENLPDASELKRDLRDLVEMFSHWHPSSKVLKELKYILEPIRSKL